VGLSEALLGISADRMLLLLITPFSSDKAGGKRTTSMHRGNRLSGIANPSHGHASFFLGVPPCSSLCGCVVVCIGCSGMDDVASQGKPPKRPQASCCDPGVPMLSMALEKPRESGVWEE